jgi:hypothetical protein
MAEDKGNAEQGLPIADKPEDEGLFFAPEHLKGSGTIRHDGTYGPPEPDPTVVRGLGPDRTSGGRVVNPGEGRALLGEEAEATLTDEERATLKADAEPVTPAPADAPKPTRRSASNS